MSAELLSDASQVSVEQATAIPGKALVSVTATDGGVRSYSVEFYAADNTPPTLRLEVDKPILKPVGHRMETIRVTPHATDEGTGVASIQLVSIVSSEPDDGIGDGNTIGDIQEAEYGTADFEFQLRAERSGQ
ncbi:hypothetical protein J19TS2_52800 [Cohnella xylanilytica]|uniref:Uncharacterized protein n=1 Tax=Cohnella xylanilytica TaxID=557555 RepID=A0A841U794_9BACL|nr:hypothetical protein [Cohnella xylanilytica]MBB6693891.1 hypothetical protein [Cohnella xylanilytica]GIO15725.1 hypothetical protein J19TS2_52800 [Cohnella xylanilytica]